MCCLPKPTEEFYLRTSTNKLEVRCRACRRKYYEAAMLSEKGDNSKMLDLEGVNTHKYYLITLLDENFNEYTGTISSVLPYKITPDMFYLRWGGKGKERLFWEVSISNLTRDEYRLIHNRDKETDGVYCPTLSVRKNFKKWEIRNVFHEFIMKMYDYHKEC